MKDSVVAKPLAPDARWALVDPLLPKHAPSPKGGPRVTNCSCLVGTFSSSKPSRRWRNSRPTISPAREALDYWKLDAELVTLSACETAVGRKGRGNGLLGFAQAFQLAGSRAVCLSLWEVDETATAVLMI